MTKKNSIKQKKVVVINPDHRFEYFPTFFSEAEYIELLTSNSVMIFDNDKMRLFSKNNEIFYNDCYFLFRGVKDDFVSILYRYLSLKGHKLDAPIQRYNDLATSKITQAAIFSFFKIPFPKTIICSKESFESNKSTIMSEIPLPFVLKKKGANGKEVWKIDTEQELKNKLKEISGELFIVQKILKSNFDIRVLVFENKIIGSMKRESDTFLHNISQGATGSKIDITKEEKNIALRAAKACETSLSGIDILRDEITGKPYVLEVNVKPGFYGERSFMSFTGIDVPKEIANIIKKKIFRKKIID